MNEETSKFEGLGLLLRFIAVLWILEAVDTILLGGQLDGFGIRPRSQMGLIGVFAWPLLHGGFGHLAANTGPLAILAALVLARGMKDLVRVTLGVTVLGGLGVWLMGGAGTVHIGASGLIFGYLGFLLLVGFVERSLVGILVSVAVGVVYGGLLWGVLPGQPGVSWEGHLCGFAAGTIVARRTPRT